MEKRKQSVKVKEPRSKIVKWIIDEIKFILDWRTFICYIPLWFLCSGWTYVLLAIGDQKLKAIAGAWLTFLWMPWSEEKLITIPAAIGLRNFLFPKHKIKQGDKQQMETSKVKIVKDTFKKINDIVCPTMGAKGRLAIINDEFGKPILTDDGVTVAKQCTKMEGFERMIALSVIEAAHNTEKSAYDGTTLTVLLTNEFYKAGLQAIKKGMHPQLAADMILNNTKLTCNYLDKNKIKPEDITDKQVMNLANLTSKIPEIGSLVHQAYLKAGKEMNIVIEHDRHSSESSINYTNGMILNEGYMSEAFKQKCDMSGKYIRNNAHIILLQEGFLTPNGIRSFFGSITEDIKQDPFIIVMDKGFNPDSMKNIMDILVQANLDFMFIMINDTKPDEVFLDLAAYTDGKVQDPSLGTTDYEMKYAGKAAYICIEQDKTTIIIDQEQREKVNEEVSLRVASYEREKEENKYNASMIRTDKINRRIANLTSGITKILVASPTVTEFMTYKLKLDDAIGAVKCALEEGLVIGGGKALYNITNEKTELNSDYKKALTVPIKVICNNAGIKRLNKKKLKQNKEQGYNVKTLQLCNLKEQGIMDSYTSIKEAILNAASIASQYIRAFIIIK